MLQYLKNKKGFILVSHDRKFLDEVVDHIISINNTNIEIQTGNYTSWKENYDRQTNYEIKDILNYIATQAAATNEAIANQKSQADEIAKLTEKVNSFDANINKIVSYIEEE